MIRFKTSKALFIAITGAAVLSACAQPGGYATGPVGGPVGGPYAGPNIQIDPQARSTQGALVGALAGTILGATRGDDANDRRQNAALGAIAGAAVGGTIGNALDRQAQELQQSLAGSGVTVARTNNSITLNLPGDITFASNSAAVSPQFRGTLDSISQTLTQYPDTRVQITGHTDNQGSYQYNQTLSQQRALSVANELSVRGVQYNRIGTAGASFSQPIADNNSDFGRAQNRRVDIIITPTQI